MNSLLQVLTLLEEGQAVAMVSDAGNCLCYVGFLRAFQVSMACMISCHICKLFDKHSCAGMPAISDAGSGLVAAAVAAGHQVVPIPGASASLAALVASGLSTSEFHFVGFLPPKSAARQTRLLSVAGNGQALVLAHTGSQLTCCTCGHRAAPAH